MTDEGATDECCSLCELPVYPVDRVESEGEVFCCQGCMLVSERVGSLDSSGSSSEAGEADVPEDADTTYLWVEGMHCTTCEIYLEDAAEDVEGVHSASASYAGGAMKVDHDSDVPADILTGKLSGRGYTVNSTDEPRDVVPDSVGRLIVGVVLGMMVMVYYALFLYPRYFGYPPVAELGVHDGLYLGLNLMVMSAAVLLYTGWPVLRGALVSLTTRQPNTDLLVATAAVAAFVYSVVAVALGRSDLYFDVTVAVILAVTLGEHYKSRAQRKASEMLEETTALQVEEARLEDGSSVAVDSLEGGEAVEVEAGERVPVDGCVSRGGGEVDESLVSGEQLPVEKHRGDRVYAGSLVVAGQLTMEVEDGAPNAVNRVVDLLWHEGSTGGGFQKAADRLAVVFVPLVAAVAFSAALLHLYLGGGVSDALLTGLVVTVVACPCALGIASPLAKAVGTKRALENGAAVSGEAVFESRGFDSVVWDKTGTLTKPELEVRRVDASREAVEKAAAVESMSSHPVARALVRYADTASAEHVVADGGALEAADFESHRHGVSAEVDGVEVVVGDRRLFERRGWNVDFDDVEGFDADERSGVVEVYVGWKEEARGRFVVGDAPREGWRDAVSWFSDRDADVYLLTGDDGASVDVFRESGVFDDVIEGVPPEAKAEYVRGLSFDGRTLMVGDGVNDAPALAAADVGVAVGDSGLSVDAADVSVEGGPVEVVEAVEVAETTAVRMRQNLGWAFTYNAVALPLAAAGAINPLFAAAAMASSSLLVVGNSLRAYDR